MITEITKLSPAQRMRMAQRMRKMSKRLTLARKRALKKTATKDVLFKRAFVSAKKQRMKKLAQGKELKDMSFGERQMISNKLVKMLPALKKMAHRLMTSKRKLDIDRKGSHETNN